MKTRKRSHLKVMLVDDDKDRAANVRAALEANGCAVVSLLASPLEIYDAVVDISPDIFVGCPRLLVQGIIHTPWGRVSFFLYPRKKQLPNPLRGNDIHPFGKGIA